MCLSSRLSHAPPDRSTRAKVVIRLDSTGTAVFWPADLNRMPQGVGVTVGVCDSREGTVALVVLLPYAEPRPWDGVVIAVVCGVDWVNGSIELTLLDIGPVLASVVLR